MTKNKIGGRTFTMSHRGTKLVVREGMNGECEFRIGQHHVPAQETRNKDKFKAAVLEAVAWLMENAGTMDVTKYERTGNES